jgi:hypothetical protein
MENNITYSELARNITIVFTVKKDFKYTIRGAVGMFFLEIGSRIMPYKTIIKTEVFDENENL